MGRVIVNILVIAIIIAGFTAIYMHVERAEPNVTEQELLRVADKFQNSVTKAHFQWVAENKPNIIILIQYDQNGHEIDRRPVFMNEEGFPKVTESESGCGKLWQMLLNQPMKVDGFQIFGEYFSQPSADTNKLQNWCRYRLSRGTHFDYYFAQGKVVKEGDT